LQVSPNATEAEIEKLVRETKGMAKHLEGKTVKKVIFSKDGRAVSFVLSS
jgi:hypothetical protein